MIRRMASSFPVTSSRNPSLARNSPREKQGMVRVAQLFARGVLLVLATSFFSSCAVLERRAEEKRLAVARAEALAAHSAWRSGPGWKSKTYRNEAVLAHATPENCRVEITLSEQRGLLLADGQIAMDFPVATGKISHPTPPGEYTVLGKQKDYSSNLYGKIVDATGAVLVSDADTTRDVPPEGATFEGAKMPCWMRLTNSGVGMHVGYVPGRPASHGCIRLKRETAVFLFGLLKIGAPVVVAGHAAALEHAGQKTR